jgi:hypothetical protein
MLMAVECLQPTQFWLGIAVHLVILITVFGGILLWNTLKPK